MSNSQAKLLREWFDWGNDQANDVAMQSAVYIDQQDALIKELVGALERLLESSESEACAAMTMEVAATNFTNPEPEIKAYEKAIVESSAAVKQARAALSRVPAEYK